MLQLWLTALLLGREACSKNTYLLKVATKYVFIFFLVKVLLLPLLLLRAAAAAHNIGTEADRGTAYCFFLLRVRYYYCCFLCVYSIAVADVEKG